MSNRFDNLKLANPAKLTEGASVDTSAAKPPESAPAPKKVGRPATGKRSDPTYVNRSFFIHEETDLDLEAALLQLKRKGIKLDKSDLVDRCLCAWMKWQNGASADACMDEITKP